jgi:hypothetical protein
MPGWLSRPLPGLFPPEGRVESPAPSALTSARTVEKNRGRLERRHLESTSILTVFEQWPGLKQGFRIGREITRGTQTSVEVVHGRTSLSVEVANAEQLLEAVRDHWRIENQLHYVRDVTLGEDACRVRRGNAPQSLAACRNTGICLLDRVDAENRIAAIQKLAARPEEAIALLHSP